MASLQAMVTPMVNVVRDGTPKEVAARDLVPGDLVLLDAGARVPADGRLVEAHALRVEESALTGESVPVDKHIESRGARRAAGRAGVDGLLGHERRRRARDDAGHCHRHAD